MCGVVTWQGRSRQVGQWEIPCAVRLRSWKTISSPWMRSSRTQPGGWAGDEQGAECWEAPQAPATCCRALPGSHGLRSQPGIAWLELEARRVLTYEATAQPRLGDGTIVGVATQVEFLIQVQALELALGSGKVRNGK